jgi:hypothetical protein
LAKVFISYARPNEEIACRAAGLLRDAGHAVWFDEHLPAHRAYSEVIEEQLESADAVVVLWSAQSVQSQWVRSEANRARERGRLVQGRIDDCSLPMPFDQLQCADLKLLAKAKIPAAWPAILNSISDLAGEGTGVSASARPIRGTGPSRRLVLTGAGAAAALAAGGGYVLLGRRSAPAMSPEAQLLLQKGLDALQSNDALETEDPGSSLQAIALLTDATQAAPNSAIAWGGLAMAYAVRARIVAPSERPGLDQRSRGAAQRSLALDGKEARALGALRLLDPPYRNWRAAERGDREALARSPKLPILLFIMASLLGDVGRYREAVTYSSQYDRTKFLLPGADRKLIIDRWSAGDLTGADSLLSDSSRRWPQHPQIWRIRIAYLMFTGRANEAIALMQRAEDRPPEIDPEFVRSSLATAEALAGARPRADGINAALMYVKSHPRAALAVGQALVALGDLATAFELFEGYYFDRGRFASLAPIGGDRDRMTGRLFQPPMKAAWSDPRFPDLLRRIGLEEYWQQSGTVPDFRVG